MARPSKSVKSYAGFRQQRTVEGKRGGILIWWDCEAGAPMGLGPDGERWCIEHRPTGNKKSTYMHVRTTREMRPTFSALARGSKDEWGFWRDGGSFSAGSNARNVSQSADSTEGGGDAQLGPHHAPPVDIAALLKAEFPDEKVVEYLRGMCEAEKPIYMNEGGEVRVVGSAPDWQTRSKGIPLLLAYREGKPVERTESIQKRIVTDEEVANKLQSNASYRKGMESYIAMLNAKDSKNPMGDVVDAEAEEVDGDEEETDARG